MNENQEKKSRSIYGYILFSLIFLFNPNISVIDVLPDFIAFFILSRVFRYAADCAPHFEEARVSFMRLGWLNFFKAFGLFIILVVKRGNSADNDIIPLVTMVFAFCEAILTFGAIKNIFDALFYLGNRTDAVATISPVMAFKKSVRPESIRTLSYVFTLLKCLAYFAPTPFLLTNVSIFELTRSSLAKAFIAVLIISQLISVVVGIIWLIVLRNYAIKIKNEGKFFTALDMLLKNNKGFSIEKKMKLRTIFTALTAFEIASFFTLELSLIENYDVNMIPHFLYAGILLFAVYKLSSFAKGSSGAYVSGGAFFTVSLASYIFQTYFLTEFGYSSLITNKTARSFYRIATAFSAAEFIALIVFLFFISKMLHSFILTNTGINENSNDLKSNESYFGALIRKNNIFFIAGIAAGAIKLLSVILHGSVKLVYSDSSEGDDLMNAVVSPAVEWIGLAVTIFAFVYIVITLYFISTLKDEVKMKYEEV